MKYRRSFPNYIVHPGPTVADPSGIINVTVITRDYGLVDLSLGWFGRKLIKLLTWVIYHNRSFGAGGFEASKLRSFGAANG